MQLLIYKITEFKYGFKMRETFSSFTELKKIDLSTQRLKYRQEVPDASAFVNIKTKFLFWCTLCTVITERCVSNVFKITSRLRVTGPF